MITSGVSVVVLRRPTGVLLHKRADFHVWDLPGGGVEPGEDPTLAAVREAREETGYLVELDGLAVEYWYPQSLRTVYLYRAHVIGGAPIERGPETLAVQWFEVDALPSRMAPFARERVHAALRNSSVPLKITRNVPFWQRMTINVLRTIRDAYNRLTGHE